MVEILERSEGNVLGVQPHGKITDADYKDVFFPKVEEIVAQHGKARLLFHPGEEFHGWEMGALWDDVRFGAKHRHDIDRIAIVGAPKLLAWSAKLGQLMIDCEFKSFDENQIDDAWEWIKG